MLAHLHLAMARSSPKAILPHTSQFNPTDHWLSTDAAEYDKLDPSLRTKDYHYTEATVHLNRADEAHRASGGSEEEPTALALGKSVFSLEQIICPHARKLTSQSCCISRVGNRCKRTHWSIDFFCASETTSSPCSPRRVCSLPDARMRLLSRRTSASSRSGPTCRRTLVLVWVCVRG